MPQPDLFGNEDDGFDWRQEWVGMPEFHQEDLTPHRVIYVRFRNDEDVQEFMRRMEQSITPKQKTIWFPFAEPRRTQHLRWVDES